MISGMNNCGSGTHVVNVATGQCECRNYSNTIYDIKYINKEGIRITGTPIPGFLQKGVI